MGVPNFNGLNYLILLKTYWKFITRKAFLWEYLISADVLNLAAGDGASRYG